MHTQDSLIITPKMVRLIVIEWAKVRGKVPSVPPAFLAEERAAARGLLGAL